MKSKVDWNVLMGVLRRVLRNRWNFCYQVRSEKWRLTVGRDWIVDAFFAGKFLLVFMFSAGLRGEFEVIRFQRLIVLRVGLNRNLSCKLPELPTDFKGF
jgi:hypothetical protein